MIRALFLLVSSALLSGCNPTEPPAGPDAPADRATFNIDRSRISVSGISSGAYMAGQLHVAHSATFQRAALLAGGPYFCAEGSLQKALGPCIQGGDTGLDALVSHAAEMANSGQIDALENLADDRVWLFHGVQDVRVSKDVVTAAIALYERIADGIETVFVDNVDVTQCLRIRRSRCPSCSVARAACKQNNSKRRAAGDRSARLRGSRPAAKGLSICTRVLCNG
jgi:hypothetical protein